MTNHLLDAALGYARAGLRVIPLHTADGSTCSCRSGSGCKSPGKHPRPHKWQDKATADAAQVHKWWDTWPDAGVGIAAGPDSGVFVLDVDPGAGGDDSLAALESEHGALSSPMTAKTGGGGAHLFFQYPDFKVGNSAGTLMGHGLDIRGEGGMVVAAPTVHASGSAYSWAPGSEVGSVAEAPPWLLDRLRPRPRPALSVVPSGWRASYESPATGIGYGASALARECQAIREAADGSRHHAVNKSCWSIGQLVGGGELDYSEARTALLDACAVHEGIGGWDKAESVKTVDDGLRDGQRVPRKRSIRAPRRAEVSESAGDGWAVADAATWHALERPAPTNDGPKDPLRTGRNVMTALTTDPRLVGQFWGDKVSRSKLWGDEELRDEHYTKVQNIIDRLYQIRVGASVVAEQVALCCRENLRDPLVEWLHALEWDGTHRAEHMLRDGFGAADCQLNRAYALCWMVGAVARAYRPGCKLDSCLILIGAQGIGKSSGLCDLVGDEWFSDTELNLAGFSQKDAMMAIGRPWVHEFAELSTLRAGRGERIKAFLSSRVDEYRPSHAREVVRRPRRCCFVGTSNDRDVLSDPTGSRRFWPVEVAKVNRKWIQENRSQLWAEAATLYRKGAQWWLPDVVESTRSDEAERYFERDAWHEKIEDYMERHNTPDRVPMSDVMDYGLKLDSSQQNKGTTRRIAAVLRALGYEKRRGRNVPGKTRPTFWAPKEK